VARKDPSARDVQPVVTLDLATPHDAFLTVLHENDRLLRSLAYRLLGDRDLMDDVLQDVYLKAFAAWGTFRGESGVATWLYRIAYNACVDELRRRGKWQPAALDESMPDTRAEPGDEVALRGDVAAALAALPVEQRAAVLLVDLHGLDYAAAAHVVGCGTGTLGSRVSRGRAALRHLLSEGNDR
jgi:RNA polymerase sigma-70 factor, ECF subfamily